MLSYPSFVSRLLFVGPESITPEQPKSPGRLGKGMIHAELSAQIVAKAIIEYVNGKGANLDNIELFGIVCYKPINNSQGHFRFTINYI